MSFSELENDTLNQAELNDLNSLDHRHLKRRELHIIYAKEKKYICKNNIYTLYI